MTSGVVAAPVLHIPTEPSTTHAMLPRPSVVIPTWNEAETLPSLLGDLAREEPWRGDLDIIVVDGGSRDGTEEAARGMRFLQVAPGRGTQLRAGARAATGDVLVFLHADVRLEPGALQEAVTACGAGRAIRFRPRIDATGLAYRLIERSADWKGRLLGWAYGDGGLVVRRADYLRAGEFADVPLFEDLMLSRRLRRAGVRLRRTNGRVIISPRRWRRGGICRTTCRNQLLTALFLLGVHPQRLALWYAR